MLVFALYGILWMASLLQGSTIVDSLLGNLQESHNTAKTIIALLKAVVWFESWIIMSINREVKSGWWLLRKWSYGAPFLPWTAKEIRSKFFCINMNDEWSCWHISGPEWIREEGCQMFPSVGESPTRNCNYKNRGGQLKQGCLRASRQGWCPVPQRPAALPIFTCSSGKISESDSSGTYLQAGLVSLSQSQPITYY